MKAARWISFLALAAVVFGAVPTGLFLGESHASQRAKVLFPRSLHQEFPGRLFVKYKDSPLFGTLSVVKAAVEETYGLELIRRYTFIDTFLYKTHWNPMETLRALSRDPNIDYVEMDRKVRKDIVFPNDPRFDSQWGLHNTGQNGGFADADIDAPEAWTKSTGIRRVIVAVLDSGIDYNHNDLKANMWINQGEIGGNGLDDDGNGYVDDLHGINTLIGDGDPMDDDGHGTHVAGIIGAVGNNGTGLSGVCWHCSLMAIKFLDEEGDGWLSNELEGIEYAVNHGADIINGSFGTYDASRVEENAIRAAQSAGLLFVFSSGNDGLNDDQTRHYPSAYDVDNIVSVSASTRRDELASWSNYGPGSVDLAAPGASILSTIPGNGYGAYSGTSMAAPHVAGTAALMKSHNSSLSWVQIKNRLLSSCDPGPSFSGKVVSGGRLNANNALIGQGSINLTLRAGSGGTTDPVPGNYSLTQPGIFTVTAVPDLHFRFAGWSGDVEAGQNDQNPLSFFLDFNRLITANFIRIIYPPAQARGEKVLNRSLSQEEYISQLTWESHPDNVGITRYKIYLLENGERKFLMQLNEQTFSYQHRRVMEDKIYTYIIVAVNSEEREGDPAVITVL